MNKTTNTLEKELELIPLSRWNDFYKYPSVLAIRQLVFYNTSNFNNKVIRKIGKRIYIKVSEFFKWVEETNRG